MRLEVSFSEQQNEFRAEITEQRQAFAPKLTERLRAFIPKFAEPQAFAPKLSEGRQTFAAIFGEYYGGATDGTPLYSGEYAVTPSAQSEQTLPTAQKKLVDDIVVEKIPFFAVSNNSGGKTVTIA